MLDPIGDAQYMAVALALSERGRGRTGANPNVGCVIVKHGIIIGRGWTQPSGRPHAEEMALAQAGAAAKGADIYVTMEPCAHESSRGPTCSNSIIDAKPKRVIVATLDADERTRRRGIDRLGDAGIPVSVGIREPKALDVRLEGMTDRSPQPVLLGNDPDMPAHWLQISEPAAIADLADINWLLVEGGSKTATSFLQAGLVDRLLFYRAPIIIGGGLPGIGDIGLEKLGDAHGQWRRSEQRQLGQDMLEIYDRAA